MRYSNFLSAIPEIFRNNRVDEDPNPQNRGLGHRISNIEYLHDQIHSLMIWEQLPFASLLAYRYCAQEYLNF